VLRMLRHTSFFNLQQNTIEWEKWSLSKEELENFEQNGFVSGIQVLTEYQVDSLLEKLDEIKDTNHPKFNLWHEFYSNETNDPNQVLMHSLGAWRISEEFHDLIFHPGVTYPAHQILNSSIRFWHDQLFCKPPKIGSVVAWHQDYSYWTRTKPMSHLTIHIALDDQTEENGCLHYVPASHKWPLLPITSRHFNDMESIKTVLTEEQQSCFNPVPILLKKGQMAIHHCLLVHGSYGNHSTSPRRATVINVFSDGVQSNTDEPLLEGMDVFKTGQPLCGRFFPLLFDQNNSIDSTNN